MDIVPTFESAASCRPWVNGFDYVGKEDKIRTARGASATVLLSLGEAQHGNVKSKPNTTDEIEETPPMKTNPEIRVMYIICVLGRHFPAFFISTAEALASERRHNYFLFTFYTAEPQVPHTIVPCFPNRQTKAASQHHSTRHACTNDKNGLLSRRGCHTPVSKISLFFVIWAYYLLFRTLSEEGKHRIKKENVAYQTAPA